MKEKTDLGAGCNSEEQELHRRLMRRPGVTLVFGATDTGKTALIRKLAPSLAQHAPTAVVDSDVGQSSIGPPACVGACLVKGVLKPWNRAEKLHFVGNFSPLGHFLPLLDGLVRLVGWALEKRTVYILVDTTGFVTGSAALELKSRKVDFTRPRHLILLEHTGELQPLLDSIRHGRNMEIHRLEVPEAASETGIDERRQLRLRSIRRYFENANLFNMPLDPQILANAQLWREAQEQDDLIGRLLGLMDRQGNTLAMGAIRDLSAEKGSLVVEAPLASIEKVTHLTLGVAKQAN